MKAEILDLLKSDNQEDNLLGVILAVKNNSLSDIFDRELEFFTIYSGLSSIRTKLRGVVIINEKLVWCNGAYALIKPEHYFSFFINEIIYTDDSVQLKK